MRISLVVLIATISSVTLLIGVVSAVSELRGANGSISLNTALLIGVAIAVGVPLIRVVRLALAKVMPFDPGSPADMVGLSVLLAIAVNEGGSSLQSSVVESIPTVHVLELVSQELALILIAFFGVGYLIQRDFRGTTERLGLKSLEPRQVWIAISLVIALFAVSAVGSELTRLFQPGLYQQINQNLGTMEEHVSSVGGALLLGISVGLGEEILFRGAIQPRYGIVFTSIVFASLHVQYGLSFTIVGIFLLSIILGLIRKRINTSASIITHAVFDTLAVLFSLAGGGGGS